MQQDRTHRLFMITLVVKGFTATFDLLFGTLLLFSGSVSTFVTFLARHELVEDPTDFLATQVSHITPYLAAHTQLFAAFYLLTHGVVKIFLVAGLLREKQWAFPVAIVVFVILLLYQIERFLRTHSILLILLTIFDAFVLTLVWREYQRTLTLRAK